MKEAKFKRGDKVCYKRHPHIYIGTISEYYEFGLNDRIYHILTSDEWFEHFGENGGPNTLSVNENDIMLYQENEK